MAATSCGEVAHAKASSADSELPDTVDTDAHSGLLEKFGLNPADLVSKLGGGGLGGLGGGLGGLGGGESGGGLGGLLGR